MELAISIVMLIVSLFLIITILLQSGASNNMSGALVGGAAESFFGKNKAKGMDGMLSRITVVAAILFIVGSLLLNIITQ